MTLTNLQKKPCTILPFVKYYSNKLRLLATIVQNPLVNVTFPFLLPLELVYCPHSIALYMIMQNIPFHLMKNFFEE